MAKIKTTIRDYKIDKPGTMTFDTREMGIRIMEAFTGEPRPKGATIEQILAQADPHIVKKILAAGNAAAEYIIELMGDSVHPVQ